MELARQPRLGERYDEFARTEPLRDSNNQLSYLAAALFADNPALFVDYVGWSKVALAPPGGESADLAHSLRCLCDALKFELPADSAELAIAVVNDAIERLPSLPNEAPSFIAIGQPHALLAGLYLQALVRGDLRAARQLILGAIEDGVTVRDIYLNVLQPSLYEIGRLWQTRQISVAREHFCAAATRSIMSLLRRQGVPDREKAERRIVTTCVAGEQHDIGIRMVSDFFEMAGWKSYYLGANTPTDSVISELIERNADALGISITMPYHVPIVAGLIEEVRRSPGCEDVKILVGGYPFSLDRNLWSTVGADGDASDAEGAVQKALNWFDA